ncbi:outer membrane protein [Bradyrhizobium sp. Cp5.3]|uniref:outer membrane protein n=1 Tax=Bradyrhizobium sp. Cp5.3 TaxID=443598 RepID=UPI000487E4F1|nr:outer membrane beta-barrel protein [Bradyrhizobium sp. Cp5.3]
MKNLLLATATIVALSAAAPALSADLASQPAYIQAPSPVAAQVYEWVGFYAGINTGWTSSQNCWDFGGISSEGCHHANGGTIGGQIGYRWQYGHALVGFEGQGNWANLSGSNVSIALPTDSIRTKVDGFGMITGQVGYAFDNDVLIYAKGGLALTSNTYEINSSLTGAPLARAGDIAWGGAVGAGVEFMFAPNWSVAVEYDHLFMQDGNLNFTTTTGPANDRIHQDVDLVTARLNYTFSPAVVVKPVAVK